MSKMALGELRAREWAKSYDFQPHVLSTTPCSQRFCGGGCWGESLRKRKLSIRGLLECWLSCRLLLSKEPHILPSVPPSWCTWQAVWLSQLVRRLHADMLPPLPVSSLEACEVSEDSSS